MTQPPSEQQPPQAPRQWPRPPQASTPRQRPVFHDSGDPVEDAKALLAPQMESALNGMAPMKFTTGEFIQGYRRARGGEPAWQHALAWLSVKQGDRRLAEQTLYGMIIPSLLRASGMVAWAGFAREQAEEDSLGVPSWWQKTVIGRPKRG